jgi:hypothetical protein
MHRRIPNIHLIVTSSFTTYKFLSAEPGSRNWPQLWHRPRLHQSQPHWPALRLSKEKLPGPRGPHGLLESERERQESVELLQRRRLHVDAQHQQVLPPGRVASFFFKKIFFNHLFFQIHTMTMQITFLYNSTAIDLKNLHPGGIRTRNFCSGGGRDNHYTTQGCFFLQTNRLAPEFNYLHK